MSRIDFGNLSSYDLIFSVYDVAVENGCLFIDDANYDIDVYQPFSSLKKRLWEIEREDGGDAAHRSVGYAPSDGLLALRDAIAQYETMKAGSMVQFQADDVCTAPGCTGVLFGVFHALLAKEPGMRVVTPVPCYPIFKSIIEDVGGAVEEYVTQEDDMFLPRRDAVADYFSRGCRAVVLTDPMNPGGAILPSSLIEGIIEDAERVGAYVIVDQIYEDLAFAGVESVFRSGYDRVIKIKGPSKDRPLWTAKRLGYGITKDETVVRGIQHANRLTSVCRSIFYEKEYLFDMEQRCLQLAGSVLDEGFEDDVSGFLEKNKRSMETVYAALAAETAVESVIKPGSGNTLFFKVRYPYGSTRLFSDAIDEKVAFSPGVVFRLPDEQPYVRISVTKDTGEIMAGLDRLFSMLHTRGFA